VDGCACSCIALLTLCPPAPAVAKSAFGLYAMYRAVKAGRTVIYSSKKGGRAVFKGGKAYKPGVDLYGLDEMADPTALYISDSLPPEGFRGAFQLLITSPKKENWSDFSKTEGVHKLVLPIFTEAEIIELRDAAFSERTGCSRSEVRALFNLWCGSARNVLTKGADLEWQDSLSSAPASLTIASLEIMLQGEIVLNGAAAGEMIHRLVNIIPRGALVDSELQTSDLSYYRFHHAELVSKHVEGLFVAHLLKKNKAELYRFLHATTAVSDAAALRGFLYERGVVIPRLARGDGEQERCELVIKPLSSAHSKAALRPVLLEAHTLGFDRLPLIPFSTAEELQSLWAKDKKDAIFVPWHKNFPVVDFVLRIGGQALLANATVSESHDIKVHNATFAEVVRAVGLGGEEKEVPFLWFLDKPAFEGFAEPGRAKNGRNELPTGIDKRLAQYKVLLEVPALPGLAPHAAAASST